MQQWFSDIGHKVAQDGNPWEGLSPAVLPPHCLERVPRPWHRHRDPNRAQESLSWGDHVGDLRGQSSWRPHGRVLGRAELCRQQALETCRGFPSSLQHIAWGNPQRLRKEPPERNKQNNLWGHTWQEIVCVPTSQSGKTLGTVIRMVMPRWWGKIALKAVLVPNNRA